MTLSTILTTGIIGLGIYVLTQPEKIKNYFKNKVSFSNKRDYTIKVLPQDKFEYNKFDKEYINTLTSNKKE